MEASTISTDRHPSKSRRPRAWVPTALAALCAWTLGTSRAEAATPYFALFFASAPKLSAQVGDPARLCVPFHFWSDELQPIARSPQLAFGSCSDAIQYEAFLDGGEILISAQLGNPVVLEALAGTAISYSLTDSLLLPCDADFIGLPFPVGSPCRLRWVTATHDTSRWHFDDASGAASFEVSGTGPRVFLPEPDLRLVLLPAFVVLRGLTGASRRGHRRQERGEVARPLRRGAEDARGAVPLVLAACCPSSPQDLAPSATRSE